MAHLREVSKLAVDETRLFRAIDEQRAIVQTAERMTKRMRQSEVRRDVRRRDKRPRTEPVIAEPQDVKEVTESTGSLDDLQPYASEVWSQD